MVKTNVKGTITLAIGDGANDVNMITEAHIGLGIKGVEGQQAARASDFYFGEFRFMKRLLFVHGRESYRKNSNLILYSFYKNVMIVMAQFWWGITNYFSGQTLYEGMHYQMFNVVYTSFPIIIYAIFDKETTDFNQLSFPKLYEMGPKRQMFNNKTFLTMFGVGAFESALIVIFSQSMMDHNWEMPNGNNFGFWVFGMVVFFGVSMLSNIKIATFTNTWSILNIVFLIGSTLMLFVTWALVSGFPGGCLENTFVATIGSASFWFVVFSVIGLGVGDYANQKLHQLLTKGNINDHAKINHELSEEKGRITKKYDEIQEEKVNEYNTSQNNESDNNQNINESKAPKNKPKFTK